MPRLAQRPLTDAQLAGDQPDLDRLPRFVTRAQIAQIGQRFYGFCATGKAAEGLPLRYRRASRNGPVIYVTRDVVALFESRLDDAPVLRGGRRPRPENGAGAEASLSAG